MVNKIKGYIQYLRYLRRIATKFGLWKFWQICRRMRRILLCHNLFIMKRLILFNTSILTSYGTFRYDPLSLNDAQKIVREFQTENKEIVSAIGHEPVAEILFELLEIPDTFNRILAEQTIVDLGLVFRIHLQNLGRRLHQGEILTRKQIEEIGYNFGLLLKTK